MNYLQWCPECSIGLSTWEGRLGKCQNCHASWDPSDPDIQERADLDAKDDYPGDDPDDDLSEDPVWGDGYTVDRPISDDDPDPDETFYGGFKSFSETDE